MKKFILGGATAFVMAFSVQAISAEFVAGKDYTVVANPTKVEVPGKIEVREFFWYGCPHCFKLEPHMQTWLKKLPKDIRFVRTPASMNPVWEQGARGYYVMEALGVRKNIHLPLFHAIHEGGKEIFSQEQQADYLALYGIPRSKFNSLFNSFAITGKVAQGNRLAQQYQLSGVPAVVVNGKYVVQGEDGKVTQVVDYLIKKERK